MIKNVVFDMGGVVFDDSVENLKQIFPHKTELEIKELLSKSFGRIFDKCDIGEKKVKTLIEELKRGKNNEDAIFLLNPDYYYITFPLKVDVLEYIIDLKNKGYRLYVLSNVSDASDEYINSMIDINSIFDGALFSDREHMHKPDPRFFNKLFEKYELDKSETIFFDDRQINVDTANNLGIKSYLFRSLEDVDSVLEEENLTK